MDLVSLYYFRELSKDLNMTKTAARLYISQQTLSNHIHRLEQYYDTPLFYRKPSLSLTCAGEFVLAFAQVVEKEEVNLRDILSDIERQERGTLRVGASMARGTQFLPRIFPDFHRRYPQVELRFVDSLSQKLEGMLTNGELDFAVVLSDRYSPALIEHELCRDPIYLCVSESLLLQHYSPQQIADLKLRSASGANIRDFARLPFALMTNRLGARLEECCQREHVTLSAPFTGPSTSQILPLCAAGVLACFCSHLSLVEAGGRLDGQINIFPLLDRGEPIVQRLSLLRHRQRYLTHFSKYFMDLLFQAAAQVEQMRISRVV